MLLDENRVYTWIILLLLFSCDYTKPSMDSEVASFEDFSKKETIAWIQKKLEKDLVGSSRGHTDITSVRVEPCFIFYGYEAGGPSGLSTMVEQDIPTDDMRIKRDGNIFYTIGMRSNCSTIDEPGMRMRFVVPEIKVRKLGKNGHNRLTLAIEHLNSFCKEGK